MMADELLNAQDLIAAKKHDTFHSEVITGKTGGVSTGADIDYATNAVTGQVQKTLPKILDDLDWSYVGLFADGVTFTDKTDFAVDAVGTQWIYTGSIPAGGFTVPPATVPSEPTYQVVHVKSASAISNANGGSVQDFIDETDAEFLRISSFSTRNIKSVNANVTPMFARESVTTPLPKIGCISSGQSLMEGGVGDDYCITQTPFNHKCKTFLGGPVGRDTEVLKTQLRPLCERQSRCSVATTMCDIVASSGYADIVIFHGQAWGGKTYDELRKGGSSGIYEKIMVQIDNALAIDSSIIYRSITIIHGEADGIINNLSYALNLNQWQIDFETDIKAKNGQTQDVNMFLCQTATAGGYGNNGGINELTFQTPILQRLAHNTYPKITMVCPKYQFDYVDNAHITNVSQAVLGEKHGEAMAYQLVTGVKWQPIDIESITVDGDKLIAIFKGTKLSKEYPLFFDTSNVIAIANMGFEYTDSLMRTITNVEIIDYNKLRITLSGAAGSSRVLAYGYHNGAGGSTNQANGLGDRGNLRSSVRTLSKITGEGNYDWCVQFRETF